MAYTVYIPDTERGPNTYTMHAFSTIKELARWAMNIALEETQEPPRPQEPAQEAARPQESVSQQELPQETAPPQAQEEQQVAAADYFVMQVMESQPVETVNAWNVDIDTWFGDSVDDEYTAKVKSFLQTRNWALLAKEFIHKVTHAAFKVSKSHEYPDG